MSTTQVIGSRRRYQFEDKFVIEGQEVRVSLTAGVLAKIEEYGLSQYEIVADLQMSAPDALSLKNNMKFAVLNPFMNTCIIASIYSDNGVVYIDGFDVRNTIPYGNVRPDGSQGYRLGAIDAILTVAQ